VRKDGADGEQLYTAALQFEQLLTQQLAQDLVPADEDLGPYAAELPDALAQSVSGGGGLGLALDLYRAMKR
jgi:Rod binding domain-containing protein